MKTTGCLADMQRFGIFEPTQNAAFFMVINAQFTPALAQYLQTLPNEFDQIPAERQQLLKSLAQYIRQKHVSGNPTQLTVICTHNSRRSHFGQAWLQIAAHFYGVLSLQSFSGGTEATAFHPNAVAALQRAGVQFAEVDNSQNPVYQGMYSEQAPALVMFSKVYHHPENPARYFAALMVCTQADEGCPVVMGAEARFAIPYQDPKEFDGTPEQTAQYDARCRQIAIEMFFAMSHVK